MVEKMSEYKGEVESWNMATATLQRFDNLLRLSSYYSQINDIDAWLGVLMDLRRNIYPFMEKKDFDDLTQNFNSLDFNWHLGNGAVNPSHYQKIYQTLDSIFLIMIKVMKDKSLLMPKPIDVGKAIIGM